MILIQLVLIVGLLIIMSRFLASRNSSRTKAWKKILLMLFTIAAVMVILFPNSMNRVAHAVGVGRGADLLLYLLVLAFIFTQLNGYVKAKEEQRRMVVLVRKVAILEALQNDASHTAGKA